MRGKKKTSTARATTTSKARRKIFWLRLESLGLQRSDFVAVVYSQDASSHTFAETVARNRGWTNVRYFTSVVAAEAWLRQAANTPVV